MRPAPPDSVILLAWFPRVVGADPARPSAVRLYIRNARGASPGAVPSMGYCTEWGILGTKLGHAWIDSAEPIDGRALV